MPTDRNRRYRAKLEDKVELWEDIVVLNEEFDAAVRVPDRGIGELELEFLCRPKVKDIIGRNPNAYLKYQEIRRAHTQDRTSKEQKRTLAAKIAWTLQGYKDQLEAL